MLKRLCSAGMLAVLLLCALPADRVHAAAVDELFADGNRLFRDDLYWAALMRYRQAQDAGMESPLLHYNMGVAHYKAQQHVRARESLKKASRYQSLQAVSHYNLGLNAWALNEIDEAMRWFQKARDQQAKPQIRKLAKRAIAQLQDENAEAVPVAVRARAEEKRREVSVFSLRAKVGGGMDSNVFRSPTEPYIDLSDPAAPLVTPVVQEGFYIPVNLNAKYAVRSFEHESFFGQYRLGGRFYQDTALTNGNEYLHELAFGTEYRRRTEERTRNIFSAFTVAQHQEVYYDRDNGIDRAVNGTDIADRFNYLRYGPEFSFRQSFKRLALGGLIKAQLWNYEDTEEVPEYDHEYFLAGLHAQYRFTRTSLLRVTADAYQRNFGDRPSFELDGSQIIGNPPVEYQYLELGVTARQRITRKFWFGVDYIRTEREDKYLGYYNYIRNGYGAELHLRIGNRFEFEASALYEVYDYENAFAFNNPIAGPKTFERARGRAMMNFDMTDHLILVAEYRYDDSTSNDARIAYNRSQISLSIRWENR